MCLVFLINIYQSSSLLNKIKVIFNGGTGGFKDRRNLESIINLLRDYRDNNINLTIKLTKDLIKCLSPSVLSDGNKPF